MCRYLGDITMLLVNQDRTELSLQQGVSWSSFEQFRKEGANSLDSVKNGVVATLQTKSGQYRILEERDFQKLYGLARDIERLREGLRIVLSATRAVEKHRDDETIKVLVESVSLMRGLPELPTRDSFEPMEPESFELDEDDEFILDPKLIKRPLDKDS